ncbi:MAG: hypothetical protein VR64_22050 [Desulfatitalea sp. BRH_c12]|nr:MAG: hypothetical protein VR64_22050 [Desulfatitalea sp. BRH_c12]
MRYRWFLMLAAIEGIVLFSMVTSGKFTSERAESVRRANQQLIEVFDLTDLALWTGARYTRHVSQADLFSAFQDSMGALERFPEGGMAPLPTPMQPPAPPAVAEKQEHDEPTS